MKSTFSDNHHIQTYQHKYYPYDVSNPASLRNWRAGNSVVLRVDMYEEGLVFHRRKEVLSYTWDEFTEATMKSKPMVVNVIVVGNEIQERTLRLKTTDNNLFVLDFSTGYGASRKNESNLKPNPNKLLRKIKSELKPIFEYYSKQPRVKWLSPGVAYALTIVLAIACMLTLVNLFGMSIASSYIAASVLSGSLIYLVYRINLEERTIIRRNGTTHQDE